MVPHIAAMLVVVLAVGLLSALPADAVAAWHPAKAAQQRSVPGHDAGYRTQTAAKQSKPKPPPAVTWPKAGEAEVGIPASGSVQAAGLPVRLGPSGKARSAQAAAGAVRVRVLDQASSTRAGVNGLLLTLAAEPGQAASGATSAPRNLEPGRPGRALVQVDYSKFRHAVGGDWASRLRLVQLPECALTAPERPECQAQTPLVSNNDVAKGLVAGEVAVPAQQSTGVVALAAGASGSAGSFAATSLSPSSTWQVGAQTGDFSWSYPLRMPPSLGGPVPQINLGYSSSAVDGQTASTNNQSSWVGTGFDFSPGYVERRYRSCSDDSSLTPKKQDLCWRYDNATMSLNGKSTELIRDDATGVWKPKDDDGSKVEKLLGATNGDDGDTGATGDKGEHWRITTPDGTQYYFGLGHLPGWNNSPITNSTWTVPVFGNDANEPCHKSGTDAADTFDKSWCQQAWRWNLDYVVDPHGNTMTYWYSPETNYYGRNLKSTGVQYTRGGTLARIDYGQRKDTIFTAKAPAQVTFKTDERCFPTGTITCSDSQFTTANAKYWPDVPVDQNCKSGASCTNLNTPTFWSRKRLTGVTTQIWNGTKYDPVDTWALRQEMKDPGDGTDKGLWLDGITHTGNVSGTTASLPEVTFEGTKLPNRVDPLQGPQMIKFRVSSITSESGGVTSVNYVPAECTQTNLPPAEDKNDKRCFPLYWTPQGATSQKLEYFQKYPVASVGNDPRISGTPPVVTSYTYEDAPAWHHDDDDGLVEEKYKTWSQWRGYGKVKITTGADGDTQSQTESLFYRGMDGDELKSGHRDVQITDSEGHAVTDSEVLEGQTREQLVYDKPDGQIQSAMVNTPWVSAATAKRVKSWGAATAAMVRTGSTATRTLLGDGTWRRTQTTTQYDDHGLTVQSEDAGDLSTGDDDTCTRTSYARNDTAGMLNYVSRELTASVACPASDAGLPDDKVISGTQNLFDGNDFGDAPTTGDVTETRRLTGFTGGAADWQTDTKSEYDPNGRVTASYEGGKADHKTTTAYTQVTGGGLVNQTVVTDPAGYKETTTYEPAWAARKTVADANGKTISQQYDPLGRLTKVWMPGRTTAMSPTAQFTYTVAKDKPAVVTSAELNADGSTYSTSYSLFDGLLRPVQTQAPAKTDSSGVVTGRTIADTFYNSSGQVIKTNAPYFNGSPPSATWYAATDNEVPGQTVTTYDGQSRPTVQAFQQLGVEKWRTTTSYTGDTLSVVPPKGGTPTTTIIDAQGKTVALRQYHGDTASGTYDETRYGYDSAQRPTTVTDPAGNVWTTHYDLLGRKTKVDDPDKGTTSYTYTDLDQTASSEDARGKKLFYDYDVLGRQTTEHADTPAGPKLAEWLYDKITKPDGSTVDVLGQAVSAIRYADGDPAKAYRTDITGYDDAYRPLGTRVTIPAVDGNGDLARTYDTTMTYNNDGSMATMKLPAAGGLADETLKYGYDALGRPKTLKGTTSYVSDTGYDGLGNLSTQLMGTTSGALVQRTYTYETGTNRLKNVVTDRQKAAPFRVENTTYNYDDAGNVLNVADRPGSSQPADNQCFRYDYLRRITNAWTGNDDCSADPSASSIDKTGPAPYWQSFGYDLTGNRTTQTDHDLGGVSAQDTTKTYAYPAAGGVRPHAVQSVTTDSPVIPGGGAGGQSVDSFGYDETGNTTRQTVGGDDETFTWDAEGNLATSTKAGQTTSFVYDADGDRLLRREPGATTLYLGDMELRLDTTGVAGTRYYTLGDATVAVRTVNGVQILADDHQGTATRAIDATTNQVSERHYTPYGSPRGADPVSWPGERGFVGGTKDSTLGLTELGAREYDADNGRFLSVDPMIDTSDPQQMNGYAYSNDSPVTNSDPSGQMVDECSHGSSTSCAGWTVGNIKHYAPSWTPWHGTYYGDAYYHEGQGSPAAEAARRRAAQAAAAKRLWAAQQKKLALKRKLANAVGALIKIAADELGITAGIDCFAKGDLAACGETALNVMLSFAGGVLGKIASRYGSPWKWAKAAKLVGAVGKLVGTITKAVKDIFKVGGELRTAEKDLAAVCRVNSFAPGIKVRLADGTDSPIEKIKLGDKVLAADPKTGRTRAMPVVATIIGVGHKDLVRITTEAPRGKRPGVIVATAGHPFWTPDTRAWTDAANLAPGDNLSTPAGKALKVLRIQRYRGYQQARNLTVAHLHTYYVQAGTASVLVHNCDGVPDIVVSRSRHPEAAQHVEDAQDAGHPSYLTIDRAGASQRRGESMRGNPSVSGKDRDEYPPAMFEEGGSGSSVRAIDPSDNRGAGSSIRHQCSGLSDGELVHIVVC